MMELQVAWLGLKFDNSNNRHLWGVLKLPGDQRYVMFHGRASSMMILRPLTYQRLGDEISRGHQLGYREIGTDRLKKKFKAAYQDIQSQLMIEKLKNA